MMSETLTQMIDALVIEKTMSLDALNAINTLKQKANELDAALKMADERHFKDSEIIRELRDTNITLTAQHNHVAALLEQSHKRVDDAQKVEQEGKEAKAELKGFRDAMAMVFKPSVVRESIQKQVPVPVEGNPGGNGHYPSAGFIVQSTETGTIERSAE